MRATCAIAILSLAAGSAAQGDVVFVRPPAATGQLMQSAFREPDGSDSDMFSYDSFIIPTGATVTEVRWRGGYIYNAQYGQVFAFRITFYASAAADTQPHCNNPEVEDDVFVAQYDVPNNAGQTLFGVVGGHTLYDYHYTLPTPFVAAPGVKYWVKIDGLQPVYPDWGICAGTGGDGYYFRYVAGYNQFQFVPGDLAFTLMGTVPFTAPAVGQQPSAASVCATGSASFTVGASGSSPAFRWQRETSPGSGVFADLADGSTGSWDGGAPGIGGLISGAATPTLIIAADTAGGRRLGTAHAGEYRCRISNACGSLASAAAHLTVCRVDVDCSGAVNSGDISGFLTVWLGSVQAGTLAGDFGGDRAVNSSDISVFLTAWLAAVSTGGC